MRSLLEGSEGNQNRGMECDARVMRNSLRVLFGTKWPVGSMVNDRQQLRSWVLLERASGAAKWRIWQERRERNRGAVQRAISSGLDQWRTQLWQKCRRLIIV